MCEIPAWPWSLHLSFLSVGLSYLRLSTRYKGNSFPETITMAQNHNFRMLQGYNGLLGTSSPVLLWSTHLC